MCSTTAMTSLSPRVSLTVRGENVINTSSLFYKHQNKHLIMHNCVEPFVMYLCRSLQFQKKCLSNIQITFFVASFLEAY